MASFDLPEVGTPTRVDKYAVELDGIQFGTNAYTDEAINKLALQLAQRLAVKAFVDAEPKA